jgi:hypothetical protein
MLAEQASRPPHIHVSQQLHPLRLCVHPRAQSAVSSANKVYSSPFK